MYDLKTLGAVTALVVSFLAGWWINGYRWEANYQSLETKHQKMVTASHDAARLFEQQAREKEHGLQAALDAERKLKDEKIKAISSQLSAALDSLRKRTPRTPSPVQMPSAPSGSSGATGAQLFREDAEFLAREAARADQVVIELNSCITAYDNAIRATK